MFDFIEIENDNKLNLHNQINNIIDIPEHQYINLFDLKNIEPDKNLLKLINKSIIKKYNIIPLFILENNQKANLPRHLESKYWGICYNKNNSKFMYIALEKNLDNIILNFLQNITNYSIIAIPIKKETVIDYYKIELEEKKENVYDIKFFVKENLLYIVFFFFIVSLLISLKIYI
ncbi:MAG: hypothetical protein KatS3mg068_1207 [Candidatus Sericytochromatia bacterium]|nr:MAG: hypothetical protein KatS3mg068_1207 [Candidatus Sericytochromatia bacterium]